MIDHRQVTFDPEKIENLTLVQDRYLDLGIVGSVQGSFVIASLAAGTLYEAILLQPGEGGPRFYMPNCSLRFDPSSAVERGRDPPLGSLIIAPQGISIIVKPPRGSPTTLTLTGQPIERVWEGICVNSWRVETDAHFGKSEILFESYPSNPATSTDRPNPRGAPG